MVPSTMQAAPSSTSVASLVTDSFAVTIAISQDTHSIWEVEPSTLLPLHLSKHQRTTAFTLGITELGNIFVEDVLTGYLRRVLDSNLQIHRSQGFWELLEDSGAQGWPSSLPGVACLVRTWSGFQILLRKRENLGEDGLWSPPTNTHTHTTR